MNIRPKEYLMKVNRIGEQYIDRQKFIRLDKNERTNSFEDMIIEELRQQISSYTLCAYPEPEPLYDKLSDHLKIDRSELFLTFGSDIAIKTVFEVFVSEGEKVLMHEPSYAMSSVYCSLFNAEKIAVPFNSDLTFDINNFCDKITKDIKLVIFENPNGFVGTGFDLNETKQIINKAAENEALILIDEAYFPFHNKTAIDFINDFDNLIISRTFSKSMSLAGVRIGYLVSNKVLMNNLTKFRPMHELSSLATIIGCFFIDHINILDETIINVNNVMSYTVTKIKNMGIEAFETDANFILIRLPEFISANEFQDRLKAKGFLVRRPFNQDFLNGLVRIGIGSATQMNILIENIQRLVKNN